MPGAEWYTPPALVADARAVLGSIELDPFSCAMAQEWIAADRWYGQDDDAFTQSWDCSTMWMNPPYDGKTMGRVVDRLAFAEVDRAMVLTNAATDTRWFHQLAGWADCLTLLRGRIRFIGPDGKPGESPRYGQVLFSKGCGGLPQRGLVLR